MTTYQRSKRDAKRAGRDLKKGDTFYVIAQISKRITVPEDSHLLHQYTVTGTHPLIGGAMVGGQSVEGIVLNEGPVYTERPAGIRGHWEPAPQVAPPLPEDEAFDRPLNAREIRELEKRVADSLADRYGTGRARREAKKLVAERLKKAA